MRLFFLISFLAAALSGQAQEWQTDLDTAKKLASEQNKPIILVFQGSDWCAPCIKLDKEIWSSDAFKNYAADHFIMLKADFPRKRQNRLSDEQQQKNEKLAEMYNQSGYFPLVCILDENGKKIGETGYKKMSPEEYIQHLESFIKS
ncbi:MAG: thioredoxin family protein [Bacteroidales bacterium]|nr:thioredoxin family protein [Bacteroidales bacterium]